MGNIDEISQALGRIEAKLEAMAERARDSNAILNSIVEDGCPRGKSNTHRLDGIEQEHRTAGGISGGISGGIAGVLAGIGAKLLDLFGK